MKNLVYVTVAAVVLSACGSGTNQNPLTNYPKSQLLEPQDPTIQAQGPNIQWKTKIEQKIEKVPTYIPREVGQVQFFSVMAPTQFQFVVGKPTIVPIRIRGLVGQMKYDVTVESATLRQLKLENIKVEGNDILADLTFTASGSDIPSGSTVGLGELNLKMSLLEVKDTDAEVEKILREKAKTNGIQSIAYGYVILPSGSSAAAVTVPAEVKGDNK